MLRRYGWILLLLALIAAWSWWRSASTPSHSAAPISGSISGPTSGSISGAIDGDRRSDPANVRALPVQVHDTLRRIQAGGPFPYRQDDGVFYNREGLLPQRARGYYREYTVATPGARDRGARRIVTGGDPPTEFYYTADHYRSFQRIAAQPERPR